MIIELPDAQNLFVIEGWLSNYNETQQIRVTQSNGFSDPQPIVEVTNASVVVQSRIGDSYIFTHTSNGFYHSIDQFQGEIGMEYRVRVRLNDGEEIRSEWERMKDLVELTSLRVNSFVENDPDNPNEEITVFYPKISARDPENVNNFYRWRFYKNRTPHIEPESITIEDDRFFDGNFIPNNFQQFGYDEGDEMIVEFQSISKEAFDYLKLLKTQITSLGTTSGTTPAFVSGNLRYLSDEITDQVLGYFGTVTISADTTTVN